MASQHDVTASNRAVPGVDPMSVRAWMVNEGLSPVGDLRLERIGLGQSNLTYRVTDDADQSWVLRRPPLGHLLESAHDVAREARILTALERTPVPVPTVYGTLPEGAVGDNAPAFLMEWVPGTAIDRLSVAEALTPEQRSAAGLSLARALAAINAVDLESTGLSTLASHKPYASRQLRRWSQQWSDSRTRTLPALDALTDRLRRAEPAHHETALLHGDCNLRNVITSPQSGEVTAVLDWELSTLGDPLSDLGILLVYWPEEGEARTIDFAPPSLEGFPSRADLIEEYARVSGRDVSMSGYWHAMGLWKIAIISEGVMRRALDEPLNKASLGTPTVEQIDAVIDRAHQVASESGF